MMTHPKQAGIPWQLLRKAAPYAVGVAGANALPFAANQARGGYGKIDPVEATSQHTIATILGLLAGNRKFRGGVGNYLTPLRPTAPHMPWKNTLSPMRVVSLAGLGGATTLAVPWYTAAGVRGRERIGQVGEAVGDFVGGKPPDQDYASYAGDKLVGSLARSPVVKPWLAQGQKAFEEVMADKGDTPFPTYVADKGTTLATEALTKSETIPRTAASAITALTNAVSGSELAQQIKPWLTDQSKNLAIQAGLAIPGTVAGYALGNALFPDKKSLTYKARRQQERNRALTQFLGASALGLGGSWAANKMLEKKSTVMNPLATTLYKLAGGIYGAEAERIRKEAPGAAGPWGTLGALGGVGLGGLVGALPGVVGRAFDSKGTPQERRKRMIQRSLMGAIPSAVVGGIGGGLLGNQNANRVNSARDEYLSAADQMDQLEKKYPDAS